MPDDYTGGISIHATGLDDYDVFINVETLGPDRFRYFNKVNLKYW